MSHGPGELLREIDPRGRLVRLTSDQWHSHILPRHPDIAGYLSAIPAVIREPEVVRRDAVQWQRECYYRQQDRPAARSLLIKVVVDFSPQEEPDGFVITCFFTTRMRPGEEVLWLPST
ncbi:MAG TPA: hypothetical protein VGR22_12235 [Thermomicrobiales bacterium]|nr:hypothetical protein [Thermomicrobiales bacterium]